MERRALPLFLASARFASDAETEPLDRLRMQKGIFLLEMRGPEAWRKLYPFSPYDWGPFSRPLASDIDELLGTGLLSTESIGGRRYAAYSTTPAGERSIAQVRLPSTHDELIRKTRLFVTSRSFTMLLRDVYGAYPKFATRSRFVG